MEKPEIAHCIYGAGVMHNLIDTLETILLETEQRHDIEYVHKTRVMLRRIRTSIRLFEDCFAGKENKKYFRIFKNAAKKLGTARDLDVKTLYLKEYMKKSGGHTKPSIDLLLFEHRDQRDLIQPEVVKALTQLRESGTLSGLRKSCDGILEMRAETETSGNALLYLTIHEKISGKIKELLALEAYVSKENEKLMHHKIRIAVKHLRYAIEIYAPLYGDGFSSEIKRLKKLQDVIGEMHDCDVWMEHLLSMASDEGIKNFTFGVRNERRILYKEFVETWKKTRKEGMLGKIQDLAYSMYNHERRKDVAAIEKAAVKYGENGGHSTQVKDLSLKLFDGLPKRPELGSEERYLLECAAILHDIGWSEGQKSHHKASMDLILSDSELHFTKRERQMVASIARYHRKRSPKKADENLSGLKISDRLKTEMLSAILRIGDALDASHHSHVAIQRIENKQGKVIIRAATSGNNESEKISFEEKKDLFMKTFNSNIMLEWGAAS